MQGHHKWQTGEAQRLIAAWTADDPGFSPMVTCHKSKHHEDLNVNSRHRDQGSCPYSPLLPRIDLWNPQSTGIEVPLR